MTDRRTLSAATALLFRVMPFVTALFLALGAAFVALTWNEPVGATFAFRGFQLGIGAMNAIVGAVILSRYPEHRVGRLLSVAGLVAALDLYLQYYSVYNVLQKPGAMPGGELAAWMQNWMWLWIATPAGPILILLFPSGKLESARWKAGVVLGLVGALGFTLSLMLHPGPLDASPLVENPYGVEGLKTWLDALQYASTVPMVASLALAVMSLVTRMRRSRGVERLQLKWISFAGAVLTTGILIYPVTEPASNPIYLRLNEIALWAALMGVPAAVGIAILRHRLYDIDRIINRAVVYSAVTLCLALAYIAIIFALGWVARAMSGDSSSLVTAISTLAVAALFRPLRNRVQSAVDHRFYRRKYDAAHTVERFAGRLRDQVDLNDLTLELREVISETMQPAHVSLWLRPPT